MYENIIIIIIELSSRIQWTYILKRSCVSFNFMKAVSNLYIFTAVPNLTRNSHKNKEHAIQIICFREPYENEFGFRRPLDSYFSVNSPK